MAKMFWVIPITKPQNLSKWSITFWNQFRVIKNFPVEECNINWISDKSIGSKKSGDFKTNSLYSLASSVRSCRFGQKKPLFQINFTLFTCLKLTKLWIKVFEKRLPLIVWLKMDQEQSKTLLVSNEDMKFINAQSEWIVRNKVLKIIYSLNISFLQLDVIFTSKFNEFRIMHF